MSKSEFKYALDRTSEDNTEVFNDIIGNNRNTFNSMIKWLNDTYSKLAKHYGNILLYNTLTGLRPDEACKSIILLQKERQLP